MMKKIAAAVLPVLALALLPAAGQTRLPYAGVRLPAIVIQEATVLSGVPAYLNWNGSGPTAAAMILGYHDGQGYPELLPGDAALQTSEINAAISSQENYDDYCLPLDVPANLLADKSELPEDQQHESNCLADFCLTSQSAHGNAYGRTAATDLGPGITDYVHQGGLYNAIVGAYDLTQVTWAAVTAEISSRRPMVFFVDSDGDGSGDLYVAVAGFVTDAETNYFGAYNTADTELHWYEFREASAGVPWGINGVYTIAITYGVFPPLNLRLTRLANDYIFFKEYINRLTWEANPGNFSRIVRHKIYRQATGDPGAGVELLAELDGSTYGYDDRGLKKGVSYIYWVSALDELGQESDPAVVRGPK